MKAFERCKTSYQIFQIIDSQQVHISRIQVTFLSPIFLYFKSGKIIFDYSLISCQNGTENVNLQIGGFDPTTTLKKT
jgi:hypothetical protein